MLEKLLPHFQELLPSAECNFSLEKDVVATSIENHIPLSSSKNKIMENISFS